MMIQNINSITDENLKTTLTQYAAEAEHYARDFPDPIARASLATTKICTEFLALDDMLGGGLAEGTLTVLRGCPGSGKTTFTTQLAKHWAAQGNLVIYYGCEDSYITLRTKMLTQELFQLAGCDPASIPSTADQLNPALYPDFSSGLWKSIRDCHNDLTTALNYDAPDNCGSNFIYINCSELSAIDIVRYTNELKKSTGKKPIVIVDYLQRLCSPIEDYNGSGADKISVDENIHLLKDLAVSMSTIVFVLGSIAKSCFAKPASPDADEGSNQILHTADNLIAICPEDAKKETKLDDSNVRDTLFRFIKHRGGQLGSVPFKYFSSADFFHCDGLETGDMRVVSSSAFRANFNAEYSAS